MDIYLPVNMISTRMKNITIYETMIWDETSGTEIANQSIYAYMSNIHEQWIRTLLF